MYLKELTLRGFKSFASATTLRFEPGITAVVGPNGSGKSNIVDALTWVMGEQGVKNLRGTAMEDVIFAGTSSRPPLGRAQVSLTIDNTDGTLDIDYTEVTITRTIFRGGGSEYAINGSACRLLDIQELLSDTGLGQQMHVIVGQGRLDAILKADPAGHRAFIEEAAGILKHRKRKERALRKLKSAEGNLARTDDLLHEIHRQLGPLGRQARISRRADGIQVNLRDAKARLYAEDVQQVTDKRDTVREQMGKVRGDLARAQHDLSQIKLRINQAEAQNSKSSPAIARSNEIWHEYSQLEERFTALSSLADERARSARSQVVSNFGEDPDLLEARAKELDGQQSRQSQSASDARLRFDEATEQRAGEEKRLAAARQTLTQLRRTSQEREGQLAALKELVAKESAAVELADTRMSDAASQLTGIQQQRDETQKQVDGLQLAAQSGAGDDADGLDEAREQLQQCTERYEELRRKGRDLDSQVIALKAKADALGDTLESRNASGALKSDGQIDVLGTLTDFVRVESGWEDAVAQALGQFASTLVVSQSEDMAEALRHARDDKLGKAVVIRPLEVVDGDNDSRTVGEGHTWQAAAGLVEANPGAKDADMAGRIVAAVRWLLQGVAAVENLDEAFRIVGSEACTQVVTRAGEVVSRVGAIGGSALKQSDLSLAARRDKALHEAQTLGNEVAKVEAQSAQARAKRDKAAKEVDRQASLRAEAKAKARQAERSLKDAQSRLHQFEGQIVAIQACIERLKDDAESHQLKLEDTQKALEQAESGASPQNDMGELERREQTLEKMLDAAREAETEAKITWSDAKRKAESLGRQAGLLHDQAKDAVRRRQHVEELNRHRREQADHAQSIAHDAATVAQLVHARLEAVGRYRDALANAASGNDEELKKLRAQRGEAEPEVARLQAQEHELDMSRERLSARYGQLEQKVEDDLGMALDELVEQYGPEQPVPVLDETGRPVPLKDDGSDTENDVAGDIAGAPEDAGAVSDVQQRDSETAPTDESNAAIAYRTVPYVRAEQERRVKKAERDLKALGKVNPLATEEFDALQKRNQYLNDQRTDVAKSRDDLLQLIKDLDKTMVEVFKSAFDDTAVAFEKVFATLFPGGKGRLRLENPDDLLTTGVIVEASPAGKRVKQLSLLSGGERSLTALALLFAIFTARPSPFYVMDEVEAALDDINLTRLINALQDLRQHAQLIIITHQQRTMAIADALYGVTMRSDGVTAVISQKLSDRT